MITRLFFLGFFLLSCGIPVSAQDDDQPDTPPSRKQRSFKEPDDLPPPPPGQPQPPPPGPLTPPPGESLPPFQEERGAQRPPQRTLRQQPPRPFLTLRFAGYTGIDLGEGDIYLNFFSASAELRALYPFTLEVGADLDGVSTSFFSRVGGQFYLNQIRDLKTGAGYETLMGLSLGYRYLQVGGFERIGLYHGGQVYLSNDYYMWMSHHFGFHMHLGLGLGAWFASNALDGITFFPEIRVAAGIAF